MAVYREAIGLMSHGHTPSYINITPQVKEAVAKSGIREGVVIVISPHITYSAFFEEFVHDVMENGIEYLQADLDHVLQEIIPNQTKLPPEGEYIYPGQTHFGAVAQWPDVGLYLPGGDKTQLLNGNAHLKAIILGSSQISPVKGGRLGIGVTGYMYFVDSDRMRARLREYEVVVMSE